MAQQGGLFDSRSEEEILAQKWQDRQAQTMGMINQVQYKSPGEQSAAQLGGLVSGALGKKFAPPTLTDQERARTGAITSANQKTKLYRVNNPDATLEDLGLESQKNLAEELIRAGDFQSGIPIAQQYAQQLQARRQAEAEFKKLGADTEYTQEVTQRNRALRGKETLQDIYLPGAVFGDQPVSAYIDKDHNAVVDNGNGPELIPLGQYFTTAPVDTTKSRSYRPSDHGIGTSEAKYLRDQRGTTMRAASDYIRLQGILAQGAKEGKTIEFMSSSGKLTDTVVSLIDNATAIARTLEKALAAEEGTSPEAQRLQVEGVNGDLSNEKVADSFIEKNAELVSDLEDYMPENVRKDATLKARWSSGMARAAYANARAEQPGARAISNDAYKNAIMALAASTTNPETFRQVAQDAMKGQIQEFRDRITGYGPGAIESVFGPTALGDFDTRMSEFDAAFSGNSGTAARPGPGLTKDEGDALINEVLGR